MSHMKMIEAELLELLEDGDTNAIIKWVKAKVLESYKNGLKTTPRSRGTRSASKRARNYQSK
jgi:hypothetical protein